jgi:hypothetical protein
MGSHSTGSEPAKTVENGISTLGPHKGLGLLVVHLDELRDGGFQCTHAAVRTSFDLPQLNRDGTINLIQEFAELDGALAWPALTDHRSRGDIQRCEEAGGGKALVIVSATLNWPGSMARIGWLRLIA